VFRCTTRPVIVSAALLVLSASALMAQESSSATHAGAATAPAKAPDAPTAALRDALIAACTQSEQSFSKFLTTRNAETFARLTPSARVALMKRFVLMNQPGKPSLLPTPSGRPTVQCETPGGAAQLQIGGAEISDNLAFLPVEVREATDTTGESVIRVQMGLVREKDDWKLLSVGLVLLDLPALAFEWDAAEMESTEKAAIDGLKKIAEAVESYRRTYAHLPESLKNLGSPSSGASAGPDAAGLLEPDLASGMRSGYRFRYVISGGSSLGAPAKYEIAATPETYGRTGRRSFFRDTNGVLHGADRQGAVGSELDPRVE
jgi:type IV pilus assembly protein PilA